MIKKLYHFYQYQLSLRTKMLITHLILTLFPALLITSFAYNQMVSVTTNTTLRSLNTLADQTRTNIATTVDQIDTMADGICSDEFFSSYVYSSHPTATSCVRRERQFNHILSDKSQYNCDT